MSIPSKEQVPGLQTLIDKYREAHTQKQKAEAEELIFAMRSKGVTAQKRDYLKAYLGGSTSHYDRRSHILHCKVERAWDEVERGALSLRQASKLLMSAKKRLVAHEGEDLAECFELELKAHTAPPVVTPPKPPRRKSSNKKGLKHDLTTVIEEFVFKTAPRLEELKVSDPLLMDRLLKPAIAEIGAVVEGLLSRVAKEIDLANGIFQEVDWKKRRKACQTLGVSFSEGGFDMVKARSVYRQKIRQYHPDVNPDSPNTIELYHQAVEAMEVLREWETELTR